MKQRVFKNSIPSVLTQKNFFSLPLSLIKRKRHLLLSKAIENNLLKVVKFLVKQKIIEIKEDTPLIEAIKRDYDDLVDFILSVKNFLVQKPAFYFELAVLSGSLKVIKIFVDKYNITPQKYPEKNFLWLAIYKGHFDIIKYLIEECKIDPPGRYLQNFKIALETGQEDIIYYLIDKCLYQATDKNNDILYSAIPQCSIGVISLLIDTCGCNYKDNSVIRNIFLHDRLDVLQYLKERYNYDIDYFLYRKEIEECTKRGKEKIFDFVLKTNPAVVLEIVEDILCNFAFNGNFKKIEELVEKYSVNPHIKCDYILTCAIVYQNLNFIKKFIENYKCDFLKNANLNLIKTIETGNLEIISFFYEREKEYFKQEFALCIKLAILNGYINVVEFFLERTPTTSEEKIINECLATAVIENRLNIFKMIIQKYKIDPKKYVVYYTNGYNFMIYFLLLGAWNDKFNILLSSAFILKNKTLLMSNNCIALQTIISYSKKFDIIKASISLLEEVAKAQKKTIYSDF